MSRQRSARAMTARLRHSPARQTARQLKGLGEAGVRLHMGDVTATSPFTVTLAGSDVAHDDLARLAGWTPAINDRVVVLVSGTGAVVLGKVA